MTNDMSGITPASVSFWKLNLSQWVTVLSVLAGVGMFIWSTRELVDDTSRAVSDQAKAIENFKSEFQKRIESNAAEIQKLNLEGSAANRSRFESEHANLTAYEARLQRAEFGFSKLAVIEHQNATMAEDIKEIKAELKSRPDK